MTIVLRTAAVMCVMGCAGLMTQPDAQAQDAAAGGTTSGKDTPAANGEEAAPTSSLMRTTPVTPRKDAQNHDDPHALRTVSMFAIAPPKPRTYEVHDLVQIIVRETSQAKSSQDLETKKDFQMDGAITQFPAFDLSELLQLRIAAGRTTGMPKLDMNFNKDFQGEGDYQRKDDFTARVTAEVVEVLPNGNLVLEAKTRIQTDDEIQAIKVTGICRQLDVTALNTVLSNQIHDLSVVKIHEGELRDASEKGFIAKALETIFAF